jgi:outer membrane protein assembly factor BamB
MAYPTKGRHVLGAFHLADGQPLWTTDIDHGRYQGSRPVVVDGVLYDTTGDHLEARHADSDELIWSWSDAELVSGQRRLTPPAVSNRRVYAGTYDGRIICWNAGDGTLRWQVESGAPCHWQPVIDRGRVFAGLEDGTLIAFATGDSRDIGWPCWGGGPGHNGWVTSTAGSDTVARAGAIAATDGQGGMKSRHSAKQRRRFGKTTDTRHTLARVAGSDREPSSA